MLLDPIFDPADDGPEIEILRRMHVEMKQNSADDGVEVLLIRAMKQRKARQVNPRFFNFPIEQLLHPSTFFNLRKPS